MIDTMTLNRMVDEAVSKAESMIAPKQRAAVSEEEFNSQRESFRQGIRWQMILKSHFADIERIYENRNRS